MQPLFVAATGQHVGKTTSTLGLIANLRDKGMNVGYCKPVGQQHISINGEIVDKDVELFAQLLNFRVSAPIHSPVVMAKGITRQYIEHPEKFNLRKNIIQSANILKASHDIVVYEGTGHPGVGSVADVSNADVAQLLKAGVIMVVEGGIGNTIDRLTLSIGQFNHYKIPIIGVIVNKVIRKKMEEIEYYVGKKLDQMGLDLLGVVPFDKTMQYPLMETVRSAIKGRVLFNEPKLANKVEDIVAGSLVDFDEFSVFNNILLVVSLKRLDEAIERIQFISKIKKLNKSPLSGIIITGDGRHEHVYNTTEVGRDYIRDHQIPVITTELDTYGSVLKISRIEVKINTRTPWKTARAIELMREHVNMDLILDKLDSGNGAS
ncbi:MAG: AAA family ATPase [Bacteroidota bacterium]